MDERKRFSKRLIRLFILGSCAPCLVILIYGAVIYRQTQNLVEPKKCIITSMYKVDLCAKNAQYLPFKQIPKHFLQALILSEDASFYSHKGFDWFELKESFRRNIMEWKYTRGGSTLTQQLAKNLYLSPEKSLTRKIKEFVIAKQIEQKMTKSQILEKYSNVVEFGKNIYGLSKASEFYFNKSPALLNILESVYLVSLLPSPKRLGLSKEKQKLSEDNIWRMKVILKRLYRFKKIPDDVFVYLNMLIETEAWPFDKYSEDMFETNPLSIKEQMMQELEFIDETDSAFLEAPHEETQLNEEPQNEKANSDFETESNTNTEAPPENTSIQEDTEDQTEDPEPPPTQQINPDPLNTLENGEAE